MKLTSSFIIVSSGLIKEGRSIDNYRRLMSGKISKIGVVTETDERTFSDIGYTLTWEGELINPNNVDLVYKQFKRYGDDYLNEWVFEIKISYREGG